MGAGQQRAGSARSRSTAASNAALRPQITSAVSRAWRTTRPGRWRNLARKELAGIGDLRPGSLFSRFRRCGKANCRCARHNDPGHGPLWFLQRQIGNTTKQRSIPVPALEETRLQIAECRRLRELTRELIEVSDAICQLRLRSDTPAPTAKKRGSGAWSRRRSPPKSSA